MEPGPGRAQARPESLQQLIQRRRAEIGIKTLDELAERTRNVEGGARISAQRWSYWSKTADRAVPQADIAISMAVALEVSRDELWAAIGSSIGMTTDVMDIDGHDRKTRVMAVLFSEQTPESQRMLMDLAETLDRARRAVEGSEVASSQDAGSADGGR